MSIKPKLIAAAKSVVRVLVIIAVALNALIIVPSAVASAMTGNFEPTITLIVLSIAFWIAVWGALTLVLRLRARKTGAAAPGTDLAVIDQDS